MKIKELGEGQGRRLFVVGNGKSPVRIDVFEDGSVHCGCKSCHFTHQKKECAYKIALQEWRKKNGK